MRDELLDREIFFTLEEAKVLIARWREGYNHIAILVNAVGEGNAYGCNVGRIKPIKFTFGSLMTY